MKIFKLLTYVYLGLAIFFVFGVILFYNQYFVLIAGFSLILYGIILLLINKRYKKGVNCG